MIPSRYMEAFTFDIDRMNGEEWIAKDGSECVFASRIPRHGQIGPIEGHYVAVPPDSFVTTTREGKIRLLSGHLFRSNYRVVCDT